MAKKPKKTEAMSDEVTPDEVAAAVVETAPEPDAPAATLSPAAQLDAAMKACPFDLIEVRLRRGVDVGALISRVKAIRSDADARAFNDIVRVQINRH